MAYEFLQLETADGIALLTVMMAFVNGMRKLTEGTGQPGNVLVLADGATDEAFSSLPDTSLTVFESRVQDAVQINEKQA